MLIVFNFNLLLLILHSFKLKEIVQNERNYCKCDGIYRAPDW